MSTNDVDPFVKWAEVKRAYAALKECLEDNGDMPVIPIKSWPQVAKNVGNLVTKATELLSEIPKAQEKNREFVVSMYEK
ncbi:MAG: hypothetical protein WC410_03580 [Candidatus Paceibacterota bacterium]|jgi:hypothetical protein|nr:hypothetical protein [Candidatus Paceibacterota bacterium]MDD5555128.1 hypothetical protein [Candidatus Paceibacterota bacterium]